VSPVVVVNSFQAVQNARSDVRTGAVCRSMNSATLWWRVQTAAMSLETPAGRAPRGGGPDIAHSGVLMGAADPMPLPAPGETAVGMDQTKRTVLSAVRAFSYPLSALTETSWSFEVVTMVTVRVTVLWDMTRCSVVANYRHLGVKWRRQQVSPNRRLISTRLHDVTSKNTAFFLRTLPCSGLLFWCRYKSSLWVPDVRELLFCCWYVKHASQKTFTPEIQLNNI
jgi:hypothetical protein